MHMITITLRFVGFPVTRKAGRCTVHTNSPSFDLQNVQSDLPIHVAEGLEVPGVVPDVHGHVDGCRTRGQGCTSSWECIYIR